MNLFLRLSVLLHLRDHLFFGQPLLAARFTRAVAFMIVMLVVGIAAKIRRAGVLGVHRSFLLLAPAMHQARPAHN